MTPTETLTADVIKLIPTDYATIQEAFDDMSQYAHLNGVTINLQFESGHHPSTGLFVEHGDYAHFRITSVDLPLVVDAAFTGSFIKVLSAYGPELDCLIDMNNKGDYGLEIVDGSTMVVLAGAGITKCLGTGLYCRTSAVRAQYSVFSYCHNRNVWITRGATASIPEADLSHCQGGEYAVWVSRASIADLSNSNVSNSQATVAAVQAERSRVNLFEADCSLSAAGGVRASQASQLNISDGKTNGSTSVGIYASGASTIDASGVYGSNCGSSGAYASEGSIISLTGCEINNCDTYNVYSTDGSTISMRGGEAKFAATKDLYVSYGGVITTHGNVATGHGTPALSDTNVSAFNAISSKGIIYA